MEDGLLHYRGLISATMEEEQDGKLPVTVSPGRASAVHSLGLCDSTRLLQDIVAAAVAVVKFSLSKPAGGTRCSALHSSLY